MNRKTADTTLGNGLRVVAVLAPGAPLAELRLVLPYASTEPSCAAAQELLAALLGTGTRAPARTRQDVADRAADLGAELSTVVTAESLILATSVLSAQLPGAMDLLADLLLRPRYSEDELALAQRRAAASPRRPGPRQRLRRAALRHGFGAHPLTDPAGPRDVSAPASADLDALHARVVVPDGALLLMTTGAEPDDALRLVRERLDAWTGGPSGLTLPPFARREPRPGRIDLVSQSPAGQAMVLTAGPAVPVADPGHAPLHLAQLTLGGLASSRLARRVRDRHGLAYAVCADLRENRAGSWLEIECAGAPGTAGRIAEEITACLRELADDGPTAREVERARAYAAGFTRFALATRTEEASALAGFAAAGLPLDWLDAYRAELAEVTHRHVAEAAAYFFDPDKTVIATHDDATHDDATHDDATHDDATHDDEETR
ncbi:insulinase family protein [Streptomyces sp. NPDC051907]|uniref:M16 family metallopeptidase n=1 Tax=Streptomyces sp. NPDC051907 TaxID=3155284 RepID=UPI003441F385